MGKGKSGLMNAIFYIVGSVVAVMVGVYILVAMLPELNTTINSAITSGGELYGLTGANLLSLIPGFLLLGFGAVALIGSVKQLLASLRGN